MAIDLTRFEMDRGQKFERHVHDAHQLAWASSGVLMVDVEDSYWVLPPTLALWIPAGTWHAALALRSSLMEGIYLDPAACPVRWGEPTVVSVSPLARELIARLADERLDPDERTRAEAVLLDVLPPAARAHVQVPMPRDERARDVAKLLLADPTDQRSLEALGRCVGASSRTLLRQFQTQTGMSFNQWRAQARMQASMAYLADGEPVSRVAERVGYATSSAFVAAFHRVTGHTPGTYFAVAS